MPGSVINFEGITFRVESEGSRHRIRPTAPPVWLGNEGNEDRLKKPCSFPFLVSCSFPVLQTSLRWHEGAGAADAEEQAALRVWMRDVILPQTRRRQFRGRDDW